LPLPLALRYHGPQFPTYNPDLGDVRAGRSRPERLRESPSRSFYASAAFAAVVERIEAFEPDPGAGLDHPHYDRSLACTSSSRRSRRSGKPIADRDDWSVIRNKLAARR
jgi:hypothetical protein